VHKLRLRKPRRLAKAKSLLKLSQSQQPRSSIVYEDGEDDEFIFDIHVFPRKPKLVKDDLSDYVKQRLEQARFAAMAKYREVWA
jgi:hypothetical protein